MHSPRPTRKKHELSKDVSAMANSAGGTIIYGIDEQKRTQGPIALDQGIDHAVISTEWLEQVIDANIQRRIDGITVHPVTMSSTGRVVYVVHIPASNRAPHMAADHRFYKRLGTTTAVMEEYEIRDVSHRMEVPDLTLTLSLQKTGRPGDFMLMPRITNDSSKPALYAIVRLYVDARLKIEPRKWTLQPETTLMWMGNPRPLASYATPGRSQCTIRCWKARSTPYPR